MLETTKKQRDRFVAARVTDGCSASDRFGGQLCRDVDALVGADAQLRDALVGIMLEFGCSSRRETAALVDRVGALLDATIREPRPAPSWASDADDCVLHRKHTGRERGSALAAGRATFLRRLEEAGFLGSGSNVGRAEVCEGK